MLELEQVSMVRGGATWIHPCSLRLEPGRPNVLLGATRSGKTSLLRLMAGLDAPTSGRILMDGEDVTGRAVRSRDVAMVYQSFVNYPRWTVRENIASPLRVKKLAAAEIEAAVARAAELLQIEPYLDRRPLELSGGQQQRVALARAIAKKARLVLLDEPLANLDFKLREELRTELPSLFAGEGAVLVYATSEPEEALLLGGMTATLKEGRVTQFGPAQEVYMSPDDLDTAQTYSDPPLNTAPDESGVLAFRAHHLRPGEAEAGELGFSARVSSNEITGSETFVHLDMAGRNWVMLLHGVHAYEPGVELSVRVRRDQLMRFDADGRVDANIRESA